MKRLPLFPEGMPPAALDKAGPLRRNPNCRKCALGERTGVANRCLPPAGEPGGLALVALYPGRLENAAGVPNVGPVGQRLLADVRKVWSGPVASANAIGCHPGEGKDNVAEPKHADACRPYIRSYLEQIAPTRILALGELAVYGLFGRSVNVRSARRGFGWVRLPHGRVPVLVLAHPGSLDGRHALAAWREDLAWACQTPDSFFADRLAFLEGGTYTVIVSAEEAREAAEVLRRESKLPRPDGSGPRGISWDVETRGKQHNADFRIISAALGVAGDNHSFVWDRAATADPAIRAPMEDLLDDPSLLFIEQGSYDERSSLCALGRPIAGERRDLRLQRRLLDCGVRKADLDTMSWTVGGGGYKDEFEQKLAAVREQVRGRGTRKSTGWDPRQGMLFDDCPDPEAREALHAIYAARDPKLLDDYENSYRYALVPTRDTSLYNARDEVVTGLLDMDHWARVHKDEGLRPLWEEVTGPVSRSMTWSEHWGVPMSREAIGALIAYAKASKAQLEPRLRAHLSEPFKNISLGSGEQVAGFVYAPESCGGLGLPPPKKTKGGADSLDKEAREDLAGKHPFIDLYNAFVSLDGDVEKGQEFLRYLREDGRVHPSILLDGTETGRPSCHDPNLFNLKSAEDCEACDGKGGDCEACEGTGVDADSRRIRTCIAAPEGFELLEVDLSQIELRGIAAITGEEVLCAAYAEGADVHARNLAAMRVKVPWAKRRDAKVGAFGIGYGMGRSGYARKTRLPAHEADPLYDAVQAIFPRTNAYKQRRIAEAKRSGYTHNYWRGRIAQRRPLWDLDSRDGARRNKAENAVFNTEIQGSFSGYLTLASHARLVEYILANGYDGLWQPLLTIYDSIVALVHKAIKPLAARMTVDVMTSWEIGRLPDGRVFPLEADCKSGPNLGIAKKYKPPETMREAVAEARRLGLAEALRKHPGRLNARSGLQDGSARR